MIKAIYALAFVLGMIATTGMLQLVQTDAQGPSCLVWDIETARFVMTTNCSGMGVPNAYADETINLDADKMEIHPDLGHIVTLTNANGNNEDETSVTINTP